MGREPLEAIMLVGGKGTRLRPLTLSAPKPLLPTAGVPFLAHQLARAAASGITHVVLATSYRAEMFTEAFGDGSALGLSVDYVYESTPLGTGGGIRNAAGLLRGGRAGDGVPGEEAEPADQQDQRRLLRLPPLGDRRDPSRAAGLGRA